MDDEHRPEMRSSAELERPDSVRSSISDIFSDEHAFDLMGVADGFRPALAPGLPSSSSSSSSSSSLHNHNHNHNHNPSSSSSSISSSTITPTIIAPRPRSPPRTNPRRPALQASMSDEKSRTTTPEPAVRRSIMKGPLPGLSAGAVAGAGAGAGASSGRNSFTLRYDTNDGPLLRRPSTMVSEMTQRPTSALSGLSIPRSQSPFMGPSAPSHPYAMYPQDTSSVVETRASTLSILRPLGPERAYSGPSRPTHPYAMYPQTTLPDTDVTTDLLAGSMDIASVGFPGLGQPYRRQLGPDGEDADDIVGPDGHLEQLPPYTRYPDTAPRIKERYAPDNPDRDAETTPLSPGPLRSSETPDAGLLAGAAPVPTDNTSEDQAAEADESASPTLPAGRREKIRAKWAQKTKRRTCFGRLPMWVIYLGIFAVIVLAATLGGAIGRYFGHRAFAQQNAAYGHPSPTVVPVATTLIEAEPLLSTPANLPPLPTGSFSLGLSSPIESSARCLTDPAQGQAWMCIPGDYLSFNVTPSDGDATQIQLGPAIIENPQPAYGPQPPVIEQSVGVTLMLDSDDPELGPAFFFQTLYTKLVVLPQIMFNGSGPPSIKRSLDQLFASESEVEAELEPRSQLQRREYPRPKPGEMPWYCYWNNTVLEGFIYDEQDSAGSAVSSVGASATALTPTSLLPTNTIAPIPAAVFTSLAGAAGPTTTSSSSSTSAQPGSSSAVSSPTTTTSNPAPAAPTASAAVIPPGKLKARQGWQGNGQGGHNGSNGSQNGHWQNTDEQDNNSSPGGSQGGSGTEGAASPDNNNNDSGGGGGHHYHGSNEAEALQEFQQKFLSTLYPKQIKLAERRSPQNMVKPFCQQMQVNNDGSVVPALDSSGKPIISMLDESEPPSQDRVAHFGAAKGTTFYTKNKRQSDEDIACLCEWMMP